MIEKVFSDTGISNEVVLDGKVTNFMPDTLLIRVNVGGGTVSNHSLSSFADWNVNGILKSAISEDVQILDCNVLDLLKISDYEAGFSAEAQAADGAGGEYVAAVDIGNIILADEDEVQITIEVPSLTDVTYDVDCYLLDLVQDNEEIVKYERLVGTGTEVLLKNCREAYLVTETTTGDNIHVRSQDGSYYAPDNVFMALGNALGQLEEYTNFGVMFSDKYELTQDTRIKLPEGQELITLEAYFDSQRAKRRNQKVQVESNQMLKKRLMDNSELRNLLS